MNQKNTNYGISQYLESKYGILIKPGKKGECPFCHHKRTFSIKADDTLGHCFHPDCGKAVNLDLVKKGENTMRNKLVKELYSIFKAELENQNSEAYKFLISRNIHPQVIEDSMMGAVPKNYDVSPLFDKYEGILHGIIDNTMEIDKKKAFEADLEKLIELKTRFIEYLQHKSECLVFFYTDKYSQITRIKLRKPFSKHITTFVFDEKVVGVFNAGVYKQNDQDLLGLEGALLITEGEFNSLQLQSMMIDEGYNYAYACSIGGVQGADFDTLKQIADKWIICYDNDESNAGLTLVKNAISHKSVRAFTTPNIESDLDSYLLSLEGNNKIEKVKALIRNANMHSKALSSIKIEINELRRNEQKLPRHELNQILAETVIAEIKDRCKLYADNNYGYLYFEESKKLVKIVKEEREIQSFLINIGINPTEKEFLYIIPEILEYCKKMGKTVKVQKFAYFDKKNFILYIHNHRDKVFKITKEKIETIQNGADNVIFDYSDSNEAFELVDIEQGKNYLKDLIINKINFDDNESALNTEDQRKIFETWFYSMFFESIMPTKPIMVMVGEKGSAKSFSFKAVGKLLFGNSFNVSMMSAKDDDFYANITNSYFLALDNLDTKLSGINDKLACIATGGKVKRRKLYTTNESAEYDVKCFLGITSRTPYFNRDDVADRLLLLYLNRLNSFICEDYFIEQVMANRNVIMSFVIRELQVIIANLYAMKDKILTTKFRMADFATFALKMASNNNEYKAINLILEKMLVNQSAFTIDGDPLVECLYILANENGNRAKEYDTRELLSALKSIAVDHRIEDFYYKSPRSLGKKLPTIKEQIKDEILIKKRTGASGKSHYTIRLVNQNDPDDVTLNTSQFDDLIA